MQLQSFFDQPWNSIRRLLRARGLIKHAHVVKRQWILMNKKKQQREQPGLSRRMMTLRKRKHISLGTAFICLNAAYMALHYGLGLDVKSCFSIVKDVVLFDYAMKLCKTEECYHDIMTTDMCALEPCDLFQFSPPCIDFSDAGGRRGETGSTAHLYQPCLEYIGHTLPKVLL